MADGQAAPAAAATDDNPNFAGEGDTLYKDGVPYVVQIQNGQLVPVQVNTTGADVAKSILPGVAQGLEAVKTAPASLASLAATGVGAAAQSLPPFPGVPQGTAEAVSGAAKNVGSALEPYTYGPEMAALTKQAPELGYEAQTAPGKFVENIGRAGPAIALTGGEGALPAISRTLGTAAGTTAGDLATGGNPWAQMVGALIGYGGAPTGALPVTTPRAAMANALTKEGVPVSAAEQTGSRVRATFEGQPAGDRTGQVSDIMLQKGGIVRPPGDTSPLSTLLQNRYNELDAQAKALKQSTSLPVNSGGLWNDLGQMDLHHTSVGTGAGTGNPTTIINPEVHQAYTDFENLAKGTPNLTGEQYSKLSQKWNYSTDPDVRAMGQRLDAEMEKLHPEWAQWNTDYANYKGLQGASDAVGGKGTTVGIYPSDVRKSMYKPTELRKFAEAAEGITGSYPEPYPVKGVSAVLGGLASTAGLATHGIQGLEAGLPFGLGQFDPVINALQGGFRSSIGQKYLMMNPKAAASALYGASANVPVPQSEGVVQK